MEREILPSELMLGNLFDNMGNVEMVMGMTYVGPEGWYISHTKRNSILIPEGITYKIRGIRLTQEWKECLGIDKYEGMPDHIEYVHEAQNWFMVHCRWNLRDVINWDKMPKL